MSSEITKRERVHDKIRFNAQYDSIPLPVPLPALTSMIPRSNRLKLKAKESDLMALEAYYVKTKEYIENRYGDIDVLDKDELERVQKRNRVMNRKNPVSSTRELNVLKPAEPIEPAEPVEPIEPTELVEPIGLVEPIEPTEPIELVEPVQPKRNDFFVGLVLGLVLGSLIVIYYSDPVFQTNLNQTYHQFHQQANLTYHQFHQQANLTYHQFHPKVAEWYFENKCRAELFTDLVYERIGDLSSKYHNRKSKVLKGTIELLNNWDN